ncbi:MAG: pitrilysin family protein, partial [candidate division Zixibacteria bacterium]|nr:pitrilysin family protein [candidate division Zixibacteria bacterium]
MKKALFLFPIMLALACAVSVAANPRDMKFRPLKFAPAEPIRFTTPNGMVVYFLEDHQLPVITTTAMFKGGTVYDPAGKGGLVDLTTRLLRTGGAGNRTSDQVDQDLDFVGASLSSGSDYDYLAASLSALKKDAALGFEILADILQRPHFDVARIAFEISNKKDKIRRQNDDPSQLTQRIFYQTIYPNHPYGVFPTLASMDNIKKDDIIYSYRKFYIPNNCILAISGDMTVDEVKGLVSQYFGKWPKGDYVIPIPPEVTMQYKPGVYYVSRDINQANIRMGHLGLTDKNPDRHAMDLMNFALGGGGFTSRLTGQVRTTAGLAYSVSSMVYNRAERGAFFAYCLTKAATMGQATGMMLDIIKKVKDSGITEDELKMAKQSYINGMVFNYVTPDQIVSAKASLELTGFPP